MTNSPIVIQRRKRRPWTIKDDQVVVELHAKILTLSQIAKSMDRDLKTIRDAHVRLGLTPHKLPPAIRTDVTRRRYDQPRQPYHVGSRNEPPAEVKPISHEASIPVIDQAKKVLGARAMEKHGAYFLDGRLASIKQFLDAANVILRERGEPQLGKHHSRWDQ
ncbi:MAG: hypothetical protein K8U57_37130 [Planctomycetes bacterium]|nr:hypothetical protein [Planctomycetota bacterium]